MNDVCWIKVQKWKKNLSLTLALVRLSTFRIRREAGRCTDRAASFDLEPHRKLLRTSSCKSFIYSQHIWVQALLLRVYHTGIVTSGKWMHLKYCPVDSCVNCG